MSAAWRLRFNRELTNPVLARARGYAEKLTFRYLQAEGIADLRYPHDIVNQAVADTLAGIRTWDPDREPPEGGMPLFRHLCRVVYSRAYHDRQRRKRQRAASIHEVRELNIDSDNSVDNLIEVKASLARDDERQHPDYQVMLRDLHDKLYTHARTRAAGDAEVLLYIGCLEEGVTKEPDIKARHGWDTKAFNRIRLRYLTVVRNLPEDVLRDAKEAIFRSPMRTGADWRRPKGVGIAGKKSKTEDDHEDDDSPLYGDDEDNADESGGGDAEEEDADESN
jgi:hypothetical protein